MRYIFNKFYPKGQNREICRELIPKNDHKISSTKGPKERCREKKQQIVQTGSNRESINCRGRNRGRGHGAGHEVNDVDNDSNPPIF